MTCRRAACALVLFAAPLVAQDTTRGVRIGLTYDPGTKPGVVVLRGAGTGADSIRAIVQRDLDFSDRISTIPLESSNDAGRDAVPNWAVLTKLGAAAAVQITPTPTGLHLAVYDVAKQTTALVRDYAAPQMSDMRGWRASLHGISDDLEESLTGTRGIARTRVLFERGGRIWVADSDGEQVIALTPTGSLMSPSWSPNGQMFVYSNWQPPAHIVVHDLITGRERTVYSGGGVSITPVFSPDGTMIAFGHGIDDGVDIYGVDAAGGNARRLSVGRGSDNTSPTFSPDGRRIAFMSGRVGHPELYSMDADGANVAPLTPVDFGENAYRANPDWSPSGQSIVFQSQISGISQIMTVNLRDLGLKQLTSDGKNEEPSWAPDARHVVFSSNRSGSKQLWVLDVETGRARQLTRGAAVRNPSWSPRLSP